MPWREASPMDQRTQFIADHLRDVRSITELCALYGVSRKTGYKWIDRYVRHGPAGLYPDRFEVRYVSANGGMRWNRRWVNVSTVCIGEYVGLEEIDDGIRNA